eukprot:3841100-Prymnesium_polylepis.1
MPSPSRSTGVCGKAHSRSVRQRSHTGTAACETSRASCANTTTTPTRTVAPRCGCTFWCATITRRASVGAVHSMFSDQCALNSLKKTVNALEPGVDGEKSP